MKSKLKTLIIPLLSLLVTSCSNISQADLDKAYQDGYDKGYSEGEVEGEKTGKQTGYDEGYETGFNNGKEIGYTDGYADGYQDGLDDTGKELSIRPGVNLVFHSDDQQKYIEETNPSNIGKYATGAAGVEKSYPNAIKLDWSDLSFAETCSSYTVLLADNKQFENALQYTSENYDLDIYNLKLNTKYYWYIKANGETQTYVSPIFNFTTKNSTIRNLYVPGTTNWRDLGNYLLTDNKRIKQGLLYRSAYFGYYDGTSSSIKEETKNCILNELKIKTDIDLAGTSSISGMNKIYAPMKWEGITNLIADSENQTQIKTVLNSLGNSNNYPAVFHCTRGRDRTGAIAFLLEAYLGVSTNDIYRDYLFTNFSANNACSLSVIQGYEDYLASNFTGNNLKERTTAYLLSIGVSQENLDNIYTILVG